MSSPTSPSLDDVTDAALGGELLSTVDPMLLVTSLARTIRPVEAVRVLAGVAGRLPGVFLGADQVEIPPRDSRFADPAWRENGFYRRWAQAYLLWEKETMSLVDNPGVDWRTRERAALLLGAITTALAPTNSLPGNPQALQRAFTTGGNSLVDGARNFVRDLLTNRGLPSQVDRASFVVGRDVATTPGWVIHRTDMFELIQYTPVTERVGAVPLLLLPPPVNKFYFWDLAPGRSLIEYAISRGIEVFTMVWRDPKPGNGTWGVDDYLRSALEALQVTTQLAGSASAHVFGDCSGGMFTCMLLGHQAATGADQIRSATLGVTVVDFGEPGGIGITASDASLRSVAKRAERGEIISANSIADTFVWMRPNDLVWRYLVSGWLLGEPPPTFDVLFWNSDGQGLPSRLALEMTKLSLDNSLIRPGGTTVLGHPIDMSAVKTDTYQIAGRTDHISPWKACFAAAVALGGQNEFVLTPTGHVQSIIYPLDKKRAHYFTGDPDETDPERWVANAERHEGSWWPHWVDWLQARSDGERPAPTSAGDDAHRPIAPAPGRYVLGE